MNEKQRRWTRRAFLGAGAGAAVGGIAAFDAFGIEAKQVHVTRHDVRVPGLPAALEGLTLAHLTDTHLPSNVAAVREAHDQVRALRPDLVLYTGDIVENREGLGPARELMQGAGGSSATIALLGNWEYSHGVSAELAERAYAQVGCELVINRQRMLRIRGVDVEIRTFDDFNLGQPDLALAEVRGAAPLRIWATHAPGVVSALAPASTPPAVMLAGHTHGGQIRLPLVPPILPTGSGGFVAGWYQVSGVPLYVSRGVGTSDIRARFLCPAEVPVFTFRRA